MDDYQPQTLRFNVGITCSSCVQSIENHFNQYTAINILSFDTNLVEKTLSIEVVDQREYAELINILRESIEELGISCEEILPIIPAAIDASEATTTITNTHAKKIKSKKKIIITHLIKGIFATLIGLGLIALSFSGLILPQIAMYALIGTSSFLTLLLGAESYHDAAKKFIKSKTLTMDALFTVSTLTVVAVSIASIFFPWLPMMLEAGLLIFGFRHIGKAIEESIAQKLRSGLKFKDRSASQVEIIIFLNQVLHTKNCAAEELQIGDTIRLKRGQICPVDGKCISEKGYIYKTIKTGSTIPSLITKGEEILAGMRIPDDVDYLEMLVEKLPNQSYLARYDKQIMLANKEKAPIETITNRILQYFVPGMMLLATAVGIGLGIFLNLALAIQTAATILVSACPCTLGFITPFAVKIGMTKALENGVQFKSSKTLQSAAEIDTVIFDLNGTLTTGIPTVVDYQIIPGNHLTTQEFFTYLASIESKSNHPIAKAITHFAADKLNAPNNEITLKNFDSSHHAGIKANIVNDEYLIGNKIFLEDNQISLDIHLPINDGQIIFVVKNKRMIGYVKVEDPLRYDAPFIIDEMHRLGKSVYICTGADYDTAKSSAKRLNIPDDHVFANCVSVANQAHDLTKSQCIKSLQAHKKRVAMIGDAANDALAITNADFGIAVKSDSGDMVTQDQAGAVVANLISVVTTFAVARQTFNSIKQNLLISLAYNVGMIALMASFIVTGLSFAINPAIGVGLMVLQTTMVLLNQYRIKKQQLSHFKRYQDFQLNNKPITSSYKSYLQSGLINTKTVETDQDLQIESVVPQQMIYEPPRVYEVNEYAAPTPSAGISRRPGA